MHKFGSLEVQIVVASDLFDIALAAFEDGNNRTCVNTALEAVPKEKKNAGIPTKKQTMKAQVAK